MIRYWKLGFFPILLTGAALLGTTQPPQALKIEKKLTYIPAGSGQKPFNVTRHIIRLADIQAGGPPQDGIPALNYPSFVSAVEAGRLLRASDIVLGVEFGATAKAYPVRILNWHEVVNDTVGRQPVLISWCPLCGSGIVFDPRIDGQTGTFGISGLLYKRNLLLYDHATESLWSQLGTIAVAGALAGTELHILPSTETTWTAWRNQHPQTLVLSFMTGYKRDYSADPYGNWSMDRRSALVVQAHGKVKLYPFAQLKKTVSPFTDDFDGTKIAIRFDSRNQTAVAEEPKKDEPVAYFVAYLADARAFYPHAPIFKAR